MRTDVWLLAFAVSRIKRVKFPFKAALLLALAGCIGREEPAIDDLSRQLAAPDAETRELALWRILQRGPEGAPDLSKHLWRNETTIVPEEAAGLAEALSVLRRQEFARRGGFSPSLARVVPWEIDSHYRAWLLLKDVVTRDEPIEFTLLIQQRFAGVPDIWIHHYEAEWTSPDIPGPSKEAPFRSLSEQVPCRFSAAAATDAASGESVFHGRIHESERSRLFEGRPARSSAEGAESRVIRIQFRFFAQTARPDARSLDSGYRKTGFLPLTVLNTTRALLESDEARYVALFEADFDREPAKRDLLARLDRVAPPLLGPEQLFRAFSRAREPETEERLLAEMRLSPLPEGTLARIVERTNRGNPRAARFLADSLPLLASGFPRPEIPTPDPWDGLSEKALKKLLAHEDPSTALAAARLLARAGSPDKEMSEAFWKRFDALAADPARAGHADALLALASALTVGKHAARLAPLLDDARMLAPADLPPLHPLLDRAPLPHDVRVRDAAAVALTEVLDRKAPGLYRDPKRRAGFAPLASRDKAIADLKAWWEKNKKKYAP